MQEISLRDNAGVQQTTNTLNTMADDKPQSTCLHSSSDKLDQGLHLPAYNSVVDELCGLRVQNDGSEAQDSNTSNQNARVVLDKNLGSATDGQNTNGKVDTTVMNHEPLQNLARGFNYKNVDSSHSSLFDGSAQQLSQLIKDTFWNNLTKRLDASNAAVFGKDPKDWTTNPRPRIFIPFQTQEQYRYYSEIAAEYPELQLDVQSLPEHGVTPKIIQEMNDRPGVLALEMEHYEDENGKKSLQALPFVVPGGRFNEMYGWDSFFATWGLLANGYVDVSESMVRNFCFSIKHYGKILNANRTYYLGRSQPPFLTSMGLSVFKHMNKKSEKALEFLRLVVQASIKDYYTTWMAVPRYNAETGLSRYHGDGQGFPPEVEPGHFEDIIGIHAEKRDIPPADFFKAYNDGTIKDRELDEWLNHDRAGRESGHDTTYRFIDRAADLATVDLNSCLYKYETDIAHIIKTYFNGRVQIDKEWLAPGHEATETHEPWTTRAAARRISMDKYLWNSEQGMYFDYDTKRHEQTTFEAATTLWPLWAGIASSEQAEFLVVHAIPKLECHGGLVSSTQKSRDEFGSAQQARQWDYPYGWAPHQMLAWDGLRRYGHDEVANRLAYRWVSMILKTFRDDNGLVVEKYDVTRTDHNGVAEAEYGNQGSDFSSEVQTGFAWTNASFVYGLKMLQSPGETRA